MANQNADLLEAQGATAREQAHYQEAIAYYQQSLALRENEPETTPEEVLSTLTELGGLLQTLNRYAEAEVQYQQALSLSEQHFGHEHPRTIRCLRNVAGIRDEQRENTEDLYREVLSLSYKVFGQGLETALSLCNFARFLRVQENYQEARTLFLEGIAIYEQYPDAERAHAATAMNNLGMLYLIQKDYGPAEKWFRRAIQHRDEVPGRAHPNLAASLRNLARCYHEQGENVLAELLLQRVQDIYARTFGTSHIETISVVSTVAQICRQTWTQAVSAALKL